jgi:malonate decarboxylase epsilon subunit
MSIAFLFPGQGAQSPGFLHRLATAHPDVAPDFAKASEVLGLDVMTLDSEQALKSTIAVQLTTVTASAAMAKLCVARGIEPQAAAGLSVGAFAAAVAAGALAFEDMLPLVRIRASLMENAYPSGYGLAAVVGLTQRHLAALVAQVHSESAPVYLANLNAPTQFVLAGAVDALELVLELARGAGARKAERMAVSVPSHCPLLTSVGDALAEAIADVGMKAPQIPYISNRGGRLLTDAESIRADLARNVMYPVLWHDATTVLYETGTRLFIEMPPGHTLTNLASGGFDDVRALALEDSRFDTVKVLAEREMN